MQHERMDNLTDFWPGLEDVLTRHTGRFGYHLSGFMALVMCTAMFVAVVLDILFLVRTVFTGPIEFGSVIDIFKSAI
jgi:hypothetical protein